MSKDKVRRIIEETADGSHTLFIPEMNEHYHSVNGAIQESRHVFIDAGLHTVKKKMLKILEVGFGTGLNALLTWQEAEQSGLYSMIEYYSVELYPVEKDLISSLNFGKLAWPERPSRYDELHDAEWDTPVSLSESFTLHKIKGDIKQVALPQEIDLIYFDAFAPDKQPDMWELPIFERIYDRTAFGGIIVTYCAKGEVRRNMQQVGFKMQRLPGPPGKRHMLFGLK